MASLWIGDMLWCAGSGVRVGPVGGEREGEEERGREREREIGRSEETSGIELARVSCLSARCESARSVLTAV